MEVPGADSDWRSPQFRQKVVAQIEDAMRKAGSGNTTHKSGTDMENHVFIKAKTRVSCAPVADGKRVSSRR
uniref:Mediator of RNA polymerase II transcription subunit 15 n=1 Tax=Xiphophorus couchianus TaxID=32473 RepID=A0A3B5KU44_9TELE